MDALSEAAAARVVAALPTGAAGLSRADLTAAVRAADRPAGLTRLSEPVG
ncbi:hypothetical protein [Micromonospora sp. MH33]|nr:hypothetical protein [Micromonospora sp. MH33]